MMGNFVRVTAGPLGRKVLLAAAVIALAVGIVGGALAGVRAQTSGDAAKHCVGQPLIQPGAAASEISAPVCFDTFEEALESIGADAGEFKAR